jgi:hypothetical protein
VNITLKVGWRADVLDVHLIAPSILFPRLPAGTAKDFLDVGQGVGHRDDVFAVIQ